MFQYVFNLFPLLFVLQKVILCYLWGVGIQVDYEITTGLFLL